MSEIKVTTRLNGPARIEGNGVPVKVYDAEGNLLIEAPRLSICTCGKSVKMPLCDGAHKVI